MKIIETIIKAITSNKVNNTISKYRVFTSSAAFTKWQLEFPNINIVKIVPIKLDVMHPNSNNGIQSSTYSYGIHVVYEEPLINNNLKNKNK